MRQKGFWILLAIAVCVTWPAVLTAADHYKVLNNPQDMYYGHISFIDAKKEAGGPSVWREGQTAPEEAVLNLPLGPGDTVRTTADSRCEIQFDTGTIIRLDFNTDLKIETILAQSLSSRQRLSNLVLSRGRVYVMYKEFDRYETFQILTANAALKLKHKTVAVLRASADKSTDAQVKYGKASVLFGGDEKSTKKQDLSNMGRLIVLADNQVQLAAYIPDTEFELWNSDVNAHFDELHKGLSALPKPLQKVPNAIFYFAQNYGNQYGEWLWDSFYGYVWKPFLNDGRYPSGWQPYAYGRWSAMGGQMYWVPEEPWGWVPYHLGIWQWDKKLGWLWLPGSHFAPAWVDWQFFYGFASWRPWTLYDWFEDWYSPGFEYGDSGWFYNLPYLPGFPNIPGGGISPGRPINRGISKDQLKDPSRALLTMPKELKAAYGRVLSAYKHQDARILDSIKGIPSHLIFVSAPDLKARRIQDKSLSWETVPKFNVPPVRVGPNAVRRIADPQGEAVRIFRGTGGIPNPSVARPADIKNDPQRPGEKPAATSAAPSRAGVATRPTDRAPQPRISNAAAARPQTATARYLDWNPDIKIARELGVRIEYASGKNEIRCPELNLSSTDRVRSAAYIPSLTPSGVTYAPSGSSGSFSGASSGSSAASASAGRSSGKEASSGTGGGSGKIKN